MVRPMAVAGDHPPPPPSPPREAGRIFDGRSTASREAVAWLDADALVVEPSGAAAGAAAPQRTRHALSDLALGERWQRGPYPVGLPDGGTLWLEARDPAFVDDLLRRAGRRQPVARALRSWPAVLACLAVLVALLVWFDRQGVSLAARTLLPLVPLGVDDAVGRRAWERVDAAWFAASRREGRDAGLHARFEAMARACGEGRSLRLLVRRQKDVPGFNALALPDGTVVILDGLLETLTEDEALAVLGHEIGHVVHRHGMDNVMRSIGLVAAAGAVLGDFSSVAAAAVGTVQWMRYSREAERQADAFARQCLARVGVDPRVMVSMWAKFRAEMDKGGAAGGLPDWLSTHPGIDERIRAAEQP